MKVCVFSGSVRNQAYVSMNLVTTIIGSVSSLLTILLIRRVNVTNGHVVLVLIMSYYQLAYDLTFFFSNVDCGEYISNIANFFQLLGGVSGSLVSNWIAFIALYIVYYRAKFDVMKNLRLIQWSCFLPGFANALFFVSVAQPDDTKENDFLVYVSVIYVYYYIRLATIVVNFLLCSFTAYWIYKRRSTIGVATDSEIAIRILSRRMIYYPIIQAIGRAGYSWYELEWGVDIDQVNNAGETQYASLMFLTVITPMVSVGYLAIFLLMQPDAYNHLMAMLQCRTYQKEMNNNVRVLSRKAAVREQKAARETIDTTNAASGELDSFDFDQAENQQQQAMNDGIQANRPSHSFDWYRSSQSGGIEEKQAMCDDNELFGIVERESVSTGNNRSLPSASIRFGNSSQQNSRPSSTRWQPSVAAPEPIITVENVLRADEDYRNRLESDQRL